MTTIAEAGRQYAHANGGHAAVAAAISVPTAHLVAWTSGVAKASTPLAVAMASALSVRVSAILAEDQDRQYLARRGAVA